MGLLFVTFQPNSAQLGLHVVLRVSAIGGLSGALSAGDGGHAHFGRRINLLRRDGRRDARLSSLVSQHENHSHDGSRYFAFARLLLLHASAHWPLSRDVISRISYFERLLRVDSYPLFLFMFFFSKS